MTKNKYREKVVEILETSADNVQATKRLMGVINEIEQAETEQILDQLDGLTSGHKIAKKVRQLFRRDIREQAEARAKKMVGELQKFEDHLKEKPTWVPEVIWRWGMKIFISAPGE